MRRQRGSIVIGRVEQPQQVGSSGTKRCVAVVIEDERLGLEVLVDLGLAERRGRTPRRMSHCSSRVDAALAVEVVDQAQADAPLVVEQAIELASRDAARILEPEQSLELRAITPAGGCERGAEALLDRARRPGQADAEIRLGPGDAARVEHVALLGEVRVPALGVPVAAIDGQLRAANVGVDRPWPRDAQHREVALKRGGRHREVREQVDLLAPHASLVGLHRESVDRPHLVAVATPDEVAVHERDWLLAAGYRKELHARGSRRAAWNSSRCPACSVTCEPTNAGSSPVCSMCRTRPVCHACAG